MKNLLKFWMGVTMRARTAPDNAPLEPSKNRGQSRPALTPISLASRSLDRGRSARAAAASAVAHDERHDERDQEEEEQDFCDPRGRAGEAGEAEDRRDDRDDEEPNRPAKHDSLQG